MATICNRLNGLDICEFRMKSITIVLSVGFHYDCAPSAITVIHASGFSWQRRNKEVLQIRPQRQPLPQPISSASCDNKTPKTVFQ